MAISQVRGAVALRHLGGLVSPGAIDAAAAHHRRPLGNLAGPAHHMRVLMGRQELGRAVHLVEHQCAIPGPDGDVGNAVVLSRNEGVLGQLAIEHVQLALGFHGEPVDRVLEFFGSIGIEMTEAAAQVRRRSHLPEQPVQRLGACSGFGRQQRAKLLGQVQQDGARLEHAHRRLHAAVHQRGNLGIGVDLDKATGELVAIADTDQPGVVLGAAMAQRQQLLQHDGDLHAVGRGQRIQLQRLLPHRQCLVVGRPGDRAVDVGEGAARGRRLPYGGRDIGGAVGHAGFLWFAGMGKAPG
ncbi:hypothetical protein GY15_17545 [Delftia sp. 670]|nr:hypothetical protein GY15_17545 [Delftia sp. 670]